MTSSFNRSSSPVPNGLRPSINLAGQAYHAVLEMIRSRLLRGGEPVVEVRLAEILGLSRTPLREALQKLEGEGMLIKTTGRAYIVRKVDLREYLHSLKVREILEAEAAVLAIKHIPKPLFSAVREEIEPLLDAKIYDQESHWHSDDSLHNLIINYCSNDVMGQILRNMRTTTRLFEVETLSDRLIPDATEHLAILDALEAGDEQATRITVAKHIRSLIQFAIDSIR